MGCLWLTKGRRQYCPSDLPLRSIPPTPAVWVPPAYGRGWPGSSGQHRLRPCISTPGQHRFTALAYPLHTSSLSAIPLICGRLGMPGLGCNKQYCPSDLPLRSIPPTPAVWAPPACGRGWPGSSGQHRLRPMHIHSCTLQPALQSPSFVVDWICLDWAAISSIVLRTFRCAPSLPHLRCGPRPLTAAGGQGPQDNTAYGLHIHSCIHQPALQLLPAQFHRNFPLCSLPLRCICGLALTDW